MRRDALRAIRQVDKENSAPLEEPHTEAPQLTAYYTGRTQPSPLRGGKVGWSLNSAL